MKLVIFTLCLDSMPYITRHLPVFEQLKCDWHWVVVEGAAANTNCTAWCRAQGPGLSRDGTSEYLNSIIKHPRVKVIRRQLWDGKLSMCNQAIKELKESCVLLQVDSDEIWAAPQIDEIVSLFKTLPYIYRMYFWCNYFLGPDIVATSTNGFGNRIGEWLRAFRFEPGMKFEKHEPPVLAGNSRGYSMGRDDTKKFGLVFNHFAYALECSVAYKERFYGYRNAVTNWRRLQANTRWPVNLKNFLPWVGEGSTADKVNL